MQTGPLTLAMNRRAFPNELGYNAVENIVHVHDLHATILRLLRIEHELLTVRFQGLDMRLTNVAGNVVKDLLA